MFGGGEGSPAGGRRRVASLVEREGSPAGELSFISDASAQRWRRWSVAVDLQLAYEAQRRRFSVTIGELSVAIELQLAD